MEFPSRTKAARGLEHTEIATRASWNAHLGTSNLSTTLSLPIRYAGGREEEVPGARLYQEEVQEHDEECDDEKKRRRRRWSRTRRRRITDGFL